MALKAQHNLPYADCFAAALDGIQAVADDLRLAGYQPYWAARAELLAKTGAYPEARHATKSRLVWSGTPPSAVFLQGRKAGTPS